MLLVFLWCFGGIVLLGGIFGGEPLAIPIGILSLLVAALWTKKINNNSKNVINASNNVKYDAKTRTLTILHRVRENRLILKIDDVRHLDFKHNPAELVYTGATSGSVSMGGFHVNEASTTVSQGGKTGKSRIVYLGTGATNNYCYIEKICLSADMIKSAKLNTTVSRFLKDDALILEHDIDSRTSTLDLQASLNAYNSGRMDIVYGLNSEHYNERQLTRYECEAIVSWISGE